MDLKKIKLLHRRISTDYVLVRRDQDKEAACRVLKSVQELKKLCEVISKDANCVLLRTCSSHSGLLNN